MRGKLPSGRFRMSDRAAGDQDVAVSGRAPHNDEEIMVLSARRMAQWAAGLLAALLAVTAVAQDNIDAGKSPAQIFADTCSACHRRPQELKRASASFLRQHYTPGAAAASAMANYLGQVSRDTRANEQRQERARTQQGRKTAPPATAKTAPATQTKASHAKAATAPKGRRATEAAKPKTAATAHAKSPEPPASEEAPPARKIVLEPFEE